ncbi:MAG TPA: hypothetical protein VI336_01025, partial [Candidatus Saccharimonadales bacterium]|nr:hypothetical protein [Candidatus Saccharimonadales bacterium]
GPAAPAASTPWTMSSTAPAEPSVRAQSAEPAKPEPPQPAQTTPEPMPTIKNDSGEFKIKRDVADSEHPETTVRIDKDGNISYVE